MARHPGNPHVDHPPAPGIIVGVRIVLQRVSEAQVKVDGEVVGRIDPAATGIPHGLLALVGVTHGDTEPTAKALADKTWRLRVLDGQRSAADLNAPILVVSQFTLYADTNKGRRPSWNAAAPGPIAEPLVDTYAQALTALGATVATGRFGAHMHVDLVNDGPVTILLEG